MPVLFSKIGDQDPLGSNFGLQKVDPEEGSKNALIARIYKWMESIKSVQILNGDIGLD